LLSLDKQKYIASLADADGHLEPAALVKDAREAGSPLHDDFEWDNTKAAEGYRLDQARSLIRQVRVIVTTEHRNIRCAAFVVDPERPPKSKRYLDISVAARDREIAEQVLQGEMGRIKAAINRAQAVAVKLELENELKDLLKNVCAISAAAASAAANARNAKPKSRPPRPPRPGSRPGAHATA
jgi:ribosomal protein L12E/L44/L45/RPP1/RPP2